MMPRSIARVHQNSCLVHSHVPSIGPILRMITYSVLRLPARRTDPWTEIPIAGIRARFVICKRACSSARSTAPEKSAEPAPGLRASSRMRLTIPGSCSSVILWMSGTLGAEGIANLLQSARRWIVAGEQFFQSADAGGGFV